MLCQDAGLLPGVGGGPGGGQPRQPAPDRGCYPSYPLAAPHPQPPADPTRRWLRRQETHGLTALGQQQARDSVRQLASIPARRVAFLTSDFTRARETAEIAAAGLEEHWLREGSLNRGGGGEGPAL